MKKGRSETEIVEILREADSKTGTLAEFCRNKGISEATYYQWRKKYRGMDTDAIKQLKQVEKENARLKKLLAERDLDVSILKEALEKKI